MSTKFNADQHLQKTPAVCKKPPPPLPNDLRTFANYPLQAFVSWAEPAGTDLTLITGPVSLEADPTHNIHEGQTAGPDIALAVELEYRPASEDFRLDVRYMIGEFEAKIRTTFFSRPQPGIPFRAGLYSWDDPISHEHVECKIYS